MPKGLMKLWLASKGKCWYCERSTWYRGTTSTLQAWAMFCNPAWTNKQKRSEARMRLATREHLHRKADGGIRSPDNIVLSCNGCNSARGLIPPDDWKAIRMGWKDGMS